MDGTEQAAYSLIEKLTGASLATLLIMVLEFGRRRVWVWGGELTQLRADMAQLRQDYETRLQEERQLRAEAAAEKEEWKQLTLRNLEVVKKLSGSSSGGAL